MNANFDTYRYRQVATTKVGRRSGKLCSLWTFQPLGVWEQLQLKKELSVDENLIDAEAAINMSYPWMKEQMKRRIVGYAGRSPWWAYFEEKPDLRGWRGTFPDGKGVRLELNIEKERLLVSSYGAWHAVESSYLALTQAEEEAWEKSCPAGWPKPEPWKSQLQISWERIFDREALIASELYTGNNWIWQACFECLRLSDVVEVAHLIPR